MESSAQLLPKGDMEAQGKEAAFDPTGEAVVMLCGRLFCHFLTLHVAEYRNMFVNPCFSGCIKSVVIIKYICTKQIFYMSCSHNAYYLNLI